MEVIKGDITRVEADAIVNAANSSLLGGGGVDGAIHRAGGPQILAACKKIGGCETGQAVITTAGNLPFKGVIHTVGPVWRGGNSGESELLASAYLASLRIAKEKGFQSLAFPNISTGVYGFPKELAAKIAIQTVQDFLRSDPGLSVMFVCFDEENFLIYKEMIQR